MEPRLKWNKIISAAKIILFHFRRGSNFHAETNYFTPEPPLSVDRPKISLFHAWFHHEVK